MPLIGIQITDTMHRLITDGAKRSKVSKAAYARHLLAKALHCSPGRIRTGPIGPRIGSSLDAFHRFFGDGSAPMPP